jgi:hypothetical protein
MKWIFLVDSIEQMLVAKFGMTLSIDDHNSDQYELKFMDTNEYSVCSVSLTGDGRGDGRSSHEYGPDNESGDGYPYRKLSEFKNSHRFKS